MNIPISSMIFWALSLSGRARDEQRGQTLAEYALIISLITLGVVLALIFLGDEIRRLFSEAGSSLTPVGS